MSRNPRGIHRTNTAGDSQSTGLLFREVMLGVLLFALGAILFAVRGYLNTGDKAVTGALIFVALVAMGIEAIVYFLGPSG